MLGIINFSPMIRAIRSKISLLLFLLFVITTSYAQEICDNGIDDDGNGLIDLNDDDCICTAFIESSLIPNPSFEEMTCCPNDDAMLNCAVEWIQASEATSDYVHTCEGYLGNTSIPAFAPLPFPDGDGAVGFRDGQFFAGSNYKEYVGACLTESMEVGVAYRLDFFVGFQDNVPGSTSFDLAFFGSTNCSNLPFGGDDFAIGCPLNVPGFVQLTQQTVSGNNGWVNVIVEFVADQPYEVIVLGPSCAVNPNWQSDPYFYVDRLALEEVGEFGIPLEDVTGSICEDDLVLSVPDDPTYSYQWYKDGVALVGETNASILLQTGPDVEGIYVAAIFTPEGCNLSREYELRIPPYYAPISVEICETEAFVIGTETISESGYYEITIPAVDGCDSIVQLNLEVATNTYAYFADTFCEGEVYAFYDLSATEAGIYEVSIPNTAGCDSIIEVDLMLIAESIGVELAPLVEVELGEVIDIEPSFYDPSLIYFNWYDEDQMQIGNELVLANYQAVDDATLYLESLDEFGCGLLDTIQVRVDKSTIRLYIPNVFSPDGNGNNDCFRYYESIALAKVETFVVFDRWGAVVYEAKDILAGDYFQGWDGTYQGKEAAIGVYAYYLVADFVDGSQEVFKGDVTLLR